MPLSDTFLFVSKCNSPRLDWLGSRCSDPCRAEPEAPPRRGAFSKRTSRGCSPSAVLPRRACRHHLYEPHGWYADGCPTTPILAFWEAWNNFTLQIWLNPLLNIAMFLPLGVLLPLAVKPFRRWYWMLTAGAGTSLVIEVLQYSLGRGQADVDDLICNILGAMLGYCLCMLFVSLAGKRWKIAGIYAVLPVLSAAVLAGVFLAYHFQPYGNLADAPIYAANTKGIEWVQECSLSDEPGPSGVYWTEPFTIESSDAFAVEFIGRQGAEIRFGTPDVDYYDNTAVYSDHQTYALWVTYKDRSYEYTDYRVDSELRFSEKAEPSRRTSSAPLWKTWASKCLTRLSLLPWTRKRESMLSGGMRNRGRRTYRR